MINLVLNTLYHLILISTNYYIIHRVQLLKVCFSMVYLSNQLGIILNLDDKGSCVKNITDMFLVNVNSLKATFPNVSREIKYKLFKTFCMSVYGSSLWDYSSKTVNTFVTAWRKSIRYLLQLPYKCRSIYFPLICNDLPVDVQLHNRF